MSDKSNKTAKRRRNNAMELVRTNTELILMEILFQLLQGAPPSPMRCKEEALRRAGFTNDELASRGVPIGTLENFSKEQR